MSTICRHQSFRLADSLCTTRLFLFKKWAVHRQARCNHVTNGGLWLIFLYTSVTCKPEERSPQPVDKSAFMPGPHGARILIVSASRVRGRVMEADHGCGTVLAPIPAIVSDGAFRWLNPSEQWLQGGVGPVGQTPAKLKREPAHARRTQQARCCWLGQGGAGGRFRIADASHDAVIPVPVRSTGSVRSATGPSAIRTISAGQPGTRWTRPVDERASDRGTAQGGVPSADVMDGRTDVLMRPLGDASAPGCVRSSPGGVPAGRRPPGSARRSL